MNLNTYPSPSGPYYHRRKTIQAYRVTGGLHFAMTTERRWCYMETLMTYLPILIFLFLTPPLYGQGFDALLDELSGSASEQLESEVLPLPKEEEKPPIPSSTELKAAELQNSSEDDEFAPVKNVVTNGVTLQGLDKQTGRVFITDARVGQAIEFGTLKIIVQHCEKAPLENRQESMAFIRITEQKPNCDVQNLFSGWMFSSSPALSALDHPVYDIWIKDCKTVDVIPSTSLAPSGK